MFPSRDETCSSRALSKIAGSGGISIRTTTMFKSEGDRKGGGRERYMKGEREMEMGRERVTERERGAGG